MWSGGKDSQACLIHSVKKYEQKLEGVREVETSNNWGNSATHTEYSVTYYDKKGSTKQLIGRSPKEAYAALIDALSGKGTWESNPYVFAYDFDLTK